METINVGLIGYGYSGATFHAPLISAVKGLALVRIASSNAPRVKQDFPDAAPTTPDDLIDAADVNLVVIATPNATHYPLAKRALLAGKHVVLEKPFTVNSAEAMELCELAQSCHRTLSVFHNRRWDNDFLIVRHCIQSGMLGEINTYQASFDRFRPQVRRRWKEDDLPGSGVLYDLGSHLIDQALVLFGTPDTVSADLCAQRSGATGVDYFHLVLGYGTRRVILHGGSIVRQPGPRFQVHGSVGSYVKHGQDPQEDALKRGMRPGSSSWGTESEAFYGDITLEQDGALVSRKLETLPGAYQTYYQDIFNAIAYGNPVPVSADEALKVIRIIELAIQSHREQRIVAFA